MRQRWIAALCAMVFAFAATAPAVADDRQIWFPQQTSTANQLNQQARNTRVALGTWIMHALNLTSVGQGIYSNLTTSPGTGLYVTVGPTVGSANGAVYQVVVDDAQSVPHSCPAAVPTCTQIAPDSTLIAPPAFQSSATNPIGPLTAPSTPGQAVYWIVEAQVGAVDTGSTNRQFLIASGQNYVPQTYSVVSDRTDAITYQTKQGTASTADCSSTFPAVPSTDSGWVLISKVCVAYGVSQILSGMITAAPSFSGFFQSVSTLSSLTVGTAATVGQINLGTDGLGYLARSGNSFTYVSPSNPTVTAGGGFLSGSSTYGPTSATVNGTANANSFVAGSSTYGSTSATVNGTATATTVNQTGTNLTSCWLCYGTLGASSADVLRFGNATSGSAYTSIGAPNSGTVSGIASSAFGITLTGSRELAMDISGNFGMNGSLNVNGSVVGGHSTAPSVSSGDGAFSRSTTTGAVKVGGSSNACTWDFNITNASAGTFNCPLYSTGAMNATQFNGSGAGLTSGTVPNAALVTPPVTSVTASGNLNSSGGTTPAITMTATPSFTAIGLDGATPAASGITCGVANTTNCNHVAQTGTTTTTGHSFDSSTGCHAGTDTYFNIKVNGSSKWSSDCSGDTTQSGSITAPNAELTGLASATNLPLCGQNNANITQCSNQATLYATSANTSVATGSSANTYQVPACGTGSVGCSSGVLSVTAGTSTGASTKWLVRVIMTLNAASPFTSEAVYGCMASASTFTNLGGSTDGSSTCVTALTNSIAGGPGFASSLTSVGLSQTLVWTGTVANGASFSVTPNVAAATATTQTVYVNTSVTLQPI